MIAPKDESSDLVMQWIESEGLGDFATFSPRLDSIVVEASISKIERLLNAEYSPFGKLPTVIYGENTIDFDVSQCTRPQGMCW
jgi:tripeptidyl-peptidase-1